MKHFLLVSRRAHNTVTSHELLKASQITHNFSLFGLTTIKNNRALQLWPFVRWIHRWTMDSNAKGAFMSWRHRELIFILAIFHGDVIPYRNISALLAICVGNYQSPVKSLHKGQWRGALMFFFYLRLNKWLGKQSWGWRFETPSRPLWRQCNVSSDPPLHIITYVWHGKP